jgi:hypothetical protein
MAAAAGDAEPTKLLPLLLLLLLQRRRCSWCVVRQ